MMRRSNILGALLRYLELNPVREWLAAEPLAWARSSDRALDRVPDCGRVKYSGPWDYSQRPTSHQFPSLRMRPDRRSRRPANNLRPCFHRAALVPGRPGSHYRRVVRDNRTGISPIHRKGQ